MSFFIIINHNFFAAFNNYKSKEMKTERLLKQLDFIKEIDKIKYIERKSKLFNSDRRENDAEHSWHLAMMVLVLSEHSNEPIDVLKVISMVLIHDIVEIDAGDIFLYDTNKSHNNTVNELKAAKRIFGMLPTEQSEKLINIWLEFEQGETKEAKFAKAIDRLEPIMQNLENEGGTWKEFEVPFDKVKEKSEPIEKGSSFIWNYIKDLIKKYYKN